MTNDIIGLNSLYGIPDRLVFREDTGGLVFADVENGDQVGMLEIHALRDAAQFHFQVVLQQLQGDFLARIAQRVVHLSKPATMNGTFDRVTVERFRFWWKGVFHGPFTHHVPGFESASAQGNTATLRVRSER